MHCFIEISDFLKYKFILYPHVNNLIYPICDKKHDHFCAIEDFDFKNWLDTLSTTNKKVTRTSMSNFRLKATSYL